MIVVLGNCIALAEHTLLPEITGIDNVTNQFNRDPKNKEWQKLLTTWYLETQKNKNIKSAQLLRLSYYEKQRKEKQIAWPTYINNCVNLSTYGSTFLGMYYNLLQYIKQNNKPNFVAILDYPKINRSCLINYNNKKYVVESAYTFTDNQQDQVPKPVYQQFLIKRKLQEAYGESYQIKKKTKSLEQLLNFCKNEKINHKIFMFYKQNREFFNEHDVIDCTHFEAQYTNDNGYQQCDTKLAVQQSIAEYVQKHI